MLIVTVISLTIGVAISSRAVSTLKQTSYTAQAGKAQKFADAGVEDVLGTADLSSLATNCPAGNACVSDPSSCAPGACALDVDGDGTSDTGLSVEELGSGPSVDLILEKDETIEVDLTGYDSTRDIQIYWVEKNSSEDSDTSGTINTEAAIVISLIYTEGGETNLAKFAFDPNGITRNNNFDTGSTGSYDVGGTTYKYKGVITNLGAGKTYQALRIRPLYNTVKNTAIVTNDGVLGTFPNQGYKITSKGTYGEAEWTVEVTKMNPALPSVFDYAIFSESDLTK